MSAAPPRPQAVTTACLFLGVACLLLLVNAISWISSWSSIETQEALQKVFTPRVLSDSGISFDEAVTWTRRLLLGVVVVLIAGVVFAVYAALGHRASRILVTIVAGFASVVFFVTGGLIGIIPAVFLVFVSVRLWSPEANDWFAVKNGKEPRSRVTPPVHPAYAQPPAGSGQQPGAHPQAYVPPAQKQPGRTGATVGLVLSAVAVAGSAFFLLVYAFAREEIVRQELDSSANWADLTEAEIRQGLDTLAVLSGIGVVAGLVGLVVSLVWLRRHRAR